MHIENATAAEPFDCQFFLYCHHHHHTQQCLCTLQQYKTSDSIVMIFQLRVSLAVATMPTLQQNKTAIVPCSNGCTQNFSSIFCLWSKKLCQSPTAKDDNTLHKTQHHGMKRKTIAQEMPWHDLQCSQQCHGMKKNAMTQLAMQLYHKEKCCCNTCNAVAMLCHKEKCHGVMHNAVAKNAASQ